MVFQIGFVRAGRTPMVQPHRQGTCDGMLVDYLAWVKMASVGMELYTILLSLQVCGVATRTMSRQ